MRRTSGEQLRRQGARLLLVALIALGIVAMHHLVRPMPMGSPAVVVAQTAGSYDASSPDHPATGEAAAQYPTDRVMAADHSASGETSSSSADNAHSSDHDLAHLCLAVLCAVMLAVAAFLLSDRRLPSPLVWFTQRIRTGTAPLRPPRRPHGFSLLLSLGVMRT